MDFLRAWRSKVSAANESLAAAHKAWRDEKLDHREQLAREEERELADRRADIDRQLEVLRAMEARRWRRRSWMVLMAILSAATGFVVGTTSGAAIIDYLKRPHASAEPSTSTERPVVHSDAPPITLEDQARREIAEDGEISIPTCVRLGVAYFKDIGSYPTLHSAPDAGRFAEDVAEERCNRSRMAFGGGL